MNIVFLSPHFPSHYFRFCLNLKAAGANVLGVGDEPYGNLSQDLRAALTEYYQVLLFVARSSRRAGKDRSRMPQGF